VILVTHDLGVVAGMCDNVNVMYAGRVVESGSVRDIFYATAHPYTEALQQSLPRANVKGHDLRIIPGMPPDLAQKTVGCPFAPRCAYARPRCGAEDAVLAEIALGHQTACGRLRRGEITLMGVRS
jgi:oligopeptide transport system ATP-binding protein